MNLTVNRKPGVMVLVSSWPLPRYIRAGVGPGREAKPIEVRTPDPPWNPRPYLGRAIQLHQERAHRLAPSVTAGGTPAGPQSRTAHG